MNSNKGFDVVVVGSGPAGVNAAYPLVKAGLRVVIIDGGLDSKKKDKQLNDFSDINLSETSNAYELIRDNSYVFNKTYELLKIKSEIEVIQSLAKGGLSEYWHGICDFFSPAELDRIGLPVKEIQKEYQEVSKQIKLKPSLPLDIHSKLILKASESKINLQSTVYRLPSAADYCSSSSIDSLKKFKNFTYIPNQLVYKVKDKEKFVEIYSISISKQLELITQTSFLILAAGSINTTRILLRSFNLFGYKTTFLTKAHYVTACLQPRTLLKKINYKQVIIGQLAMSSNEIDQGLDAFFIQLFRFNPLAVTKALKYIPLPKLIALALLSIMAPSLVVADIRLPAFETRDKFCRLKRESNGQDTLEIVFRETGTELENHQVKLKKIMQQLRELGLLPLKTGSDYVTAHYAGGAPFQDKAGKLSVDANSKLHQAKRIYVADSSAWRALPAKSPTLTIMAHASWVGKVVARKVN